MVNKTQAMRALDAKKIAYVAKTYDAAGEFHAADEAAALIGADADSVYKTLVVLSDGAGTQRPLLVMIASDRQLDLKLLAKGLGEKKLRMATQREAERLTGLQVGGISALALLNRPFDPILDERARELVRIHVSGGARGVDLELSVADLVELTGARFVAATSDE
jgi:Cys-tRNA(Pro)/Cys-tRNA(Cys) deacylase